MPVARYTVYLTVDFLNRVDGALLASPQRPVARGAGGPGFVIQSMHHDVKFETAAGPPSRPAWSPARVSSGLRASLANDNVGAGSLRRVRPGPARCDGIYLTTSSLATRIRQSVSDSDWRSIDELVTCTVFGHASRSIRLDLDTDQPPARNLNVHWHWHLAPFYRLCWQV
jgi:hypothetical protein